MKKNEITFRIRSMCRIVLAIISFLCVLDAVSKNNSEFGGESRTLIIHIFMFCPTSFF